jgi:hypothetical protein
MHVLALACGLLLVSCQCKLPKYQRLYSFSSVGQVPPFLIDKESDSLSLRLLSAWLERFADHLAVKLPGTYRGSIGPRKWIDLDLDGNPVVVYGYEVWIDVRALEEWVYCEWRRPRRPGLPKELGWRQSPFAIGQRNAMDYYAALDLRQSLELEQIEIKLDRLEREEREQLSTYRRSKGITNDELLEDLEAERVALEHRRAQIVRALTDQVVSRRVLANWIADSRPASTLRIRYRVERRQKGRSVIESLHVDSDALVITLAVMEKVRDEVHSSLLNALD